MLGSVVLSECPDMPTSGVVRAWVFFLFPRCPLEDLDGPVCLRSVPRRLDEKNRIPSFLSNTSG